MGSLDAIRFPSLRSSMEKISRARFPCFSRYLSALQPKDSPLKTGSWKLFQSTILPPLPSPPSMGLDAGRHNIERLPTISIILEDCWEQLDIRGGWDDRCNKVLAGNCFVCRKLREFRGFYGELTDIMEMRQQRGNKWMSSTIRVQLKPLRFKFRFTCYIYILFSPKILNFKILNDEISQSFLYESSVSIEPRNDRLLNFPECG